MTNQPIKISDNCWKHTDKLWHFFYRKTSDPDSELHREDGPAIEWADGDKSWHINNKLHRKDGPAVEYANGDKVWYINGKRHREDGPAVETITGTKRWYINGRLHRIDGPAIEYVSGYKAWYINGTYIDVSYQKEFELYVKNLIFI